MSLLTQSTPTLIQSISCNARLSCVCPVSPHGNPAFRWTGVHSGFGPSDWPIWTNFVYLYIYIYPLLNEN